MRPATRQQIYTAAIILLVTLFFVGLYLVLSSNLERLTRERVGSEARHAGLLVEEWLNGYSRTAGLAAAGFSSGKAIPVSANQCRQMSLSTPGDMWVVLHPDGKLLVCENGKESVPGAGSAFQERWRAAFAAGGEGARLAGPLPSLEGGVSQLAVVYGQGSGESVHGGLALVLPLSRLRRLLQDTGDAAPFPGYMVFVNGREAVPVGAEEVTPLRASDMEILLDFAASPDTRMMPLPLNGTDYIAAKRTMGESSWQCLFLIAGYRDDQALVHLGLALSMGWLCQCGFVAYLFAQVRKSGAYKALSERDALTGAGNRLGFERALEELEHGGRFPACLIMMDVDGLKIINDDLDHEMGDSLLCRSVRVLHHSLRDTDAVFRIGGDEFAVLVPETPYAMALPLLDRINANITASREKKNLPPVYASLGLAEARGVQELTDLIRRADAAMYANKNRLRQPTQQALQKWLRENPRHKERRGKKEPMEEVRL